MKINELATVRYSQIEAFLASGQTAAEWCKENDMRKSIDLLATLVQLQFGTDPFNNALYVFYNKGSNKCKILRWTNNGWWLYYQKLSKGFFRWKFDQGKQVLEVSERQFRWLMDGMSIDQPTAHKPVNQQIFL